MPKIITSLIVVAVVILTGYLLWRPPGVASPPPASASGNIVTYTDAGYSPPTVRVKAGASVVFRNNSSQSMWTASDQHPTHRNYNGTSLSEHCAQMGNTVFDACTGTQPNGSWSFTFNQVGSWTYHDHLHPANAGTIIVEGQ